VVLEREGDEKAGAQGGTQSGHEENTAHTSARRAFPDVPLPQKLVAPPKTYPPSRTTTPAKTPMAALAATQLTVTRLVAAAASRTAVGAARGRRAPPRRAASCGVCRGEAMYPLAATTKEISILLKTLQQARQPYASYHP